MTTLFTGLTPPDADCIHTPLIEIVPMDLAGDASKHCSGATVGDASKRCSSVHDYDYLLFTSRFAVKYFLNGQWSAHIGQRPRIVSIGKTTTAALLPYLQGKRLSVTEVEHDNSYGVIDWFTRQPKGRVLIPRSSLALDIIPDGLRELGFEVDCVTAYINRMPLHPKKVNLKEIDRIVFTSPSTIDHFVSLYGALPTDKTLVTRGPVTEQHLQTIIKQQLL